MEIVYSRGVSEALFLGLQILKKSGIVKESRAGKVIEYPEPVCTVYTEPQERVLFYEERDANPFFHFFEAFWMIAGRQDVAYLGPGAGRAGRAVSDGGALHRPVDFVQPGGHHLRWFRPVDRDVADCQFGQQARTVVLRDGRGDHQRACAVADARPHGQADRKVMA